MTTDKVTKILLALIALGLFLNALNPWLRPMTTRAANSELSSIASDVAIIRDKLNSLLQNDGFCRNPKICD